MWLEYLILIRISIDIPQLDEMLMDGIESGTVTIISGPIGVGKGLLSMRIAAEACI